MKRKLLLVSFIGLFSVVTTAVPHGQSGEGQSAIPRTSDGRPDLQGIWNFADYTPLQRPTQFGDRATLTPEEAAEYQAVTQEAFNQLWAVQAAYDLSLWGDAGEMGLRTALIVDPPNGRLPEMTAAGKRRAAEQRARRQQSRETEPEELRGYTTPGPEAVGVWARCIIGPNTGPPIRPTTHNNTLQIFQNSDTVAMYHEQIHDVRTIPLNGQGRSGVPRLQGESRGAWDGDTLVVESMNFRAVGAAAFAPGASENMRVTERFSMIDADTLRYEFTVEDPTVWVAPWTAWYSWKRGEGIYEYACHEGNRGMTNVLTSARQAEREFAEKSSVPD